MKRITQTHGICISYCCDYSARWSVHVTIRMALYDIIIDHTMAGLDYIQKFR